MPTIESSLILQNGDATLAGVLYCFGRQYQALERENESAVLVALQRRFDDQEFPLFFLIHKGHMHVASPSIQGYSTSYFIYKLFFFISCYGVG